VADLLVILIPVAITALMAGLRGRARNKAGKAADELGLSYSLMGSLVTMEGVIDGVAVSVVEEQSQDGPLVHRIVASGDHGPDTVRLSHEWFAKGPGSTELQIGDRPFDRKVYLEGSDATVAAYLTAGARGTMLELMRSCTVVVERGRVQATTTSLGVNEKELVGSVRLAVELFKALSGDGEAVAARLLHNAQHDPVASVRRTNLRLLLAHHADSNAAAQAAHLALEFDNPELRVLAAGQLAIAEGDGSALAAAVRDEQLPVEHRLRALELTHPLGFAFVRELEGLLDVSDVRVCGAVAERIGATGTRKSLPALHRRAATAKGAAAVGIARALMTLAYDDNAAPAQTVLLRFLEDDSSDAQEAAAIALGKLGTVDAVAALMERSTGLFRSDAVKSAARAAVVAIQGRLQGADAGDLALVKTGTTDGELSLAHDDGELSLAGDERAKHER